MDRRVCLGRGVAGRGRIMAAHDRQERYASVGAELQERELKHAEAAFENFKNKLTQFALAHRERIVKDPTFRQHFHEMCTAVGVDPLASSKSVWTRILGIGNFYTELSIQVLTVCMITRDDNGGLLEIQQCLRQLRNLRSGVAGDVASISASDVRRAIEQLEVLGDGGVRLLRPPQADGRGGTQTNTPDDQLLILSVSEQLSIDQVACLQVIRDAPRRGCVDRGWLFSRLGWTAVRIETVLNIFVGNGMAWIDFTENITGVSENSPPLPKCLYWFPVFALARVG
eukprot:GHVT01009690.1.p1 GENE.GHVT01009690.1~~GHVT01009690.1.p1  ORF type:complete len:284 (-),score=19.27 GHVT01009690.1:2610-3461(-)